MSNIKDDMKESIRELLAALDCSNIQSPANIDLIKERLSQVNEAARENIVALLEQQADLNEDKLAEIIQLIRE